MVQRLRQFRKVSDNNARNEIESDTEQTSRCSGDGNKIVLKFDRASLDHQAIFGAWFEWVGSGAFDRWMHSSNGGAIGKFFDGR